MKTQKSADLSCVETRFDLQRNMVENPTDLLTTIDQFYKPLTCIQETWDRAIQLTITISYQTTLHYNKALRGRRDCSMVEKEHCLRERLPNVQNSLKRV